jgi:restriction endonuclease-like protein
MGNGASHFAGELRREICARNAVLSEKNGLAHVQSYGAVPITVYEPAIDGRHHGNFYSPSYRAILKRKEWARRLQKVHTQARSSLPQAARRWRELDSCTSSDALLMNVFCCPAVCGNKAVTGMLGTESCDVPEFGYRPRIRLWARTANDDTLLQSGKVMKPRFDRTEIDMRLGRLLVESKLTENDFQTAPASFVTNYQDLEEVFDVESLPRSGECFISYQLIRSVLAAYSNDSTFCVMLDERRPDLMQSWHLVMGAVRTASLRTRCKVLTWQELSTALPRGLRRFLEVKYGIVAA